MSEKIIIFVLWISFGIQMLFYIFFYARIFLQPKQFRKTNTKKTVSVIICAKNEYENLKEFLPKVLSQKYPVFELVVVNDGSSDLSSELLRSLSSEHKNLNVIELDAKTESRGKKNALKTGIEASKYEYLLLTDADCYPETEKWIETMMSGFSDKTDIVLGYGAYQEKKGFLNKLIRFDTLSIALKYMSFAKAGFSYMGVGRNLAYKKSIFVKNNGFESHKHILSGDDDLFVNETASKENVSIVVEYNGITKSIPKKNLKELLKQKRRHLSTGFKYKTIHKILLGAESASSVFFYFSLLTAISLNISPIVALAVYGFKFFIQTVTVSFFSGMVKEKRNLIFISIFDVLIPIINLYAVISNFFISNKEWK